MKKSYIGYAPKQSNVVKLANYIKDSNAIGEAKESKLPKKTIKKRYKNA